MKRKSIFSRQSEVIDVHDLRDLGSRRWFKSPRIVMAISLALIVIAAVSWWTYAVYLKPSRDQRLVDEVTTMMEANPKMSGWSSHTATWPEERRLIATAHHFQRSDIGIPPALGARACRAALELAIHKGSKEAQLVLGKLLRDGAFGEKNAKAAFEKFQRVYEELKPGILAGDQDALYFYSLMLKEGLGIETNLLKAREILKQVALSRDFVVMEKIGTSAVDGRGEDRDLELAKVISRKLIDTGHPESYTLGVRACDKEFETDPAERAQFSAMLRSREDVENSALLSKLLLQVEQRKQCRIPFLQAAAEKGEEEAVRALASLSHDDASPKARKQAPQSTALAADPEAQSRTGYLDGTKQIAKGGLSTFKVDNTKGGGDAVVRLYRDGKKPAARNMFVKNGESFTAEAVAPGAYRLRYRYIGSADTFEAEETFALSETPTETGTRFSRMTVTLYKVANGNMTVKKVDASEF